jgi:hypothetical protein
MSLRWTIKEMNDRIADFTNNRFYTRLGEVGKNVLKD